jgi:ribosomal protein L13E
VRKGKGFSEKEIIEAEINFDDLDRINITYDRRRKSYHQVNITTLEKLKRGN